MHDVTSKRSWLVDWRIGCETAMTGRIIRLHGDPHRDVQSLLPWYVTGRLDAAEQAEVEAHLSACPECQAELKFERRLKAEIVGLPMDVERGWALLQRRMELNPPKRAGRAPIRAWLTEAGREASRGWRAGGPWLGWAMVAPLMLLVFAVRTQPPTQAARYHALGAAPVSAAGNLVVMFRPDISERALRQTLRASHARLVDGPTSTDAYVLQVPAADRTAALATLRARAEVALAEPIDSDEPR
jgi:anti-sigma factor RsiW